MSITMLINLHLSAASKKCETIMYKLSSPLSSTDIKKLKKKKYLFYMLCLN